MAVLAPLSAAPADPRLTTWQAASLRWWLLSSPTASVADVGQALEHLIQRGAPATSWWARVEGGAEQVRYAVEVSGGALKPEPCSGRRRTATGQVGSGGAASVLDAAQSVDLDLLLVGVEGEADTVAARGGAPAMAAGAGLMVLWPAGAPWIAVGCSGAAPPPIPAGAMVDPVPIPRTPTQAATRPRVAPRGLLALGAALAVAVAGSGVAVWRMPRSESPGATTAGPAGARSLPPGGALASAVLPMPRRAPSVVYDAAQDQALLFGGLGQTGSTWLWAHGAWTAPQTHGSPPDRTGAAAAYDPFAKRVLVFGGRRADGTTPGDTWAWDGRSWSRLIGTGAGPAGAAGAGMAYDEADRAMVLVTAGAGPTASAQTWTLAGARWVAQTAGDLPVGPSPTMAFDPGTRTVLLVTTGSVPGGAARTWSWDGTTARWRELHPASEPSGAGTGFLTPDPLSGRLLLVTPPSSQAVFPLQTWAWDGRTWSRLQPATNPRFAVGLVTDRRDGVVVCFGFSRPGVPGTIDAAWAWTGTTWVELAAAPIPRFTETIASPPPRVQAWQAYNPADDRLVLFGGTGEFGEQLHDTWLWDGRSWAEAAGAGGPPAGGPMAFDPVSRAVILVTDAVGLRALPRPQTWSWNGVTWRSLAPAREIPSSLAVIALEQDPAAGQVVALALCCAGPDGRPGPGPRLQTWTWDGSTWTSAHPSTEVTGGGHMEMAYDATTQRLIAIVESGSGRSTATWAWDGSSWTQLQATAPAAGDAPTITMAADPSTGSIVILQAVLPASVAVSPQQLMAIWTGATWTAISSPEPSPQVDTTTHATQPFFEPHLGRLMVLGSPEHDFSRAWMWTGRSWLELDAPHL